MLLKDIFKTYNIELNDFQLDCFTKYYHFLISENKKYNLTAITDEIDVYYKHFLDSVLPYKYFKPNTSVFDVGSGAGFPAIPLAILRNDLYFTLIDSVNKKVNFINNLIELLNLKNVKAIHTRCEDFANVSRETFDYVIARAVAPMNTLCEYLIPFAKVNGEILMYKGNNYNEEIKLCGGVLKMFHVKHFDTMHFEINIPKCVEKIICKINNADNMKNVLDKENTKEINKNTRKCEKNIQNHKVNPIINTNCEINNDYEIIERNIIILKKNEKTDKKYPRSGNKPRLNPLK